MSCFSGEWWGIDGSVDFADGDVGDANHEGIALNQANSVLADLCGMEYDSDQGFEEFHRQLIQQAEEDGLFSKPGSVRRPDEAARLLIANQGGDPKNYTKLIDTALGQGDPREYAMINWGWIWCKGTWFGLKNLKEQRANLISTVESILDNNGCYDGDDEMTEALDTDLRVAQIEGDQVWTTLRELRDEGAGSGAPLNPQGPNAAGPNAQLKAQDQVMQHPAYRGRLGDSARRVIQQIIKG